MFGDCEFQKFLWRELWYPGHQADYYTLIFILRKSRFHSIITWTIEDLFFSNFEVLKVQNPGNLNHFFGYSHVYFQRLVEIPWEKWIDYPKKCKSNSLRWCNLFKNKNDSFSSDKTFTLSKN